MIIVGASGHGKSLLDINKDQIVEAFYDDSPRVSQIYNIPVHYLNEVDWVERKVGVIGIGDNEMRKTIVKRLRNKIRYVNLIHPSVIKSPNSTWGEGIVAMEGAIIKIDVVLGHHVIINTGVSIDHDCEIGDFVHLAPQVTLCGNVRIEEGAFLGAASVVLPGIRIGKWSIIGAGSVVHKDVPKGKTWIGNKLVKR